MNIKQQLLDGVDAILGKGGLIEALGMRHQKEQHKYARNVAEGILRGTDDMASMTLIEAATGTGKTIGYGIPHALYAALTGERVAISTYTLHLQRQIMAKDMPIILSLVEMQTGKKLHVARRIGMRNFISLSKLTSIVEDMDIILDDDRADLDALIAFAKAGAKGSGGEIAVFLEENNLQRLPCNISIDHVSLSSDCPEDETKAFKLHCEESRMADIVVTSHAMMAVHTKGAFAILDDGRKISALAVDEADRFPEAANSILEQRFPVARVRAMLEKVEHPDFAKCAEAAKVLETVLLKSRIKYGDGVHFQHTGDRSLIDALDGLSTCMKALLKKVATAKLSGQKKMFALDPVIRESMANLLGYNIRLTELVKQFRGDKNATPWMEIAISYSPSKKFPTIAVVPLNPGYFFSKLWLPRRMDEGESLYLNSCLMTSATLGDPGRADVDKRFEGFMKESGIFAEARLDKNSEKKTKVLNINTDLFESFEPSMYGKMSFVLADPRLPRPLMKNGENVVEDDMDESESSPMIPNPVWMTYVANTICYAANDLGGRTLVLTNSYKDVVALEAMMKSIPQPPRPNVIYHHKGVKIGDLIQSFKDDENGVLITPGGWEGVSIVDESGQGMISNLVITRLPYGGRDSIKAHVKQRQLKSQGRSDEEIKAIMHVMYASAARRKMMQGLGRPIRSFKDKCVVFITDPRFPLVDKLESKMEFGIPKIRTEASFHNCVPRRFRNALRDAAVMRKDGTIFF